MTYINRQKQVIWTSPSGKVFTLLTDGKIKFSRKRKGEVKNNPTRSYGKNNNKTSYKTVNMSDDTFQDKGVSGRDFSLKIYFIGDDHDIRANEFDTAYCEHGKSKIQLPFGTIMTVQALDIDYEQDIVGRIGITEIDLSFHECGITIYPTAMSSDTSFAKKNISKIKNTISENFADAVQSLNDKQTFATRWMDNLDKLSKKFADIQDSEILSILHDIQSQNILNNSFVMSTQLGLLFKKGFNAYQNIYNVFEDISDIIMRFFPSRQTSSPKSKYIADDLFIKTAIIAACEVLTDTKFELRKDAIAAIDKIQDINDEYIEESQEIEQIINQNIKEAVINNSNTNDIVNNVIGSIISKCDDLKIEKNVVLKENSNPLMIAYEYYPDLFSKNPDVAIEYVNKTNNFEGDNLIFVEKGTKIVVYV